LKRMPHIKSTVSSVKPVNIPFLPLDFKI